MKHLFYICITKHHNNMATKHNNGKINKIIHSIPSVSSDNNRIHVQISDLAVELSQLNAAHARATGEVITLQTFVRMILSDFINTNKTA